MTTAILEHINVTVNDSKATAARLCDLFDWKIRWEGGSMDGLGYTCHVGGENSYLAVYSPVGGTKTAADSTYIQSAGLNHVGLVVDDIDAMEARVKAAGYVPKNHGDYEPGKRFYFNDHDGIEYEVVAYN